MSELPINQVVCGAFPAATRGWPDDKINLVMFSPPYWGLRNYGENVNAVWGGDPRCEHEWGKVIKHRTAGGPQVPQTKWQANVSVANAQRDVESGFCSKCGAWYGQLGLEPTYQMYVEHMVEVGREVKRILRKDGSWYLTLGDTYFGDSPVRNQSNEKWERVFTGQDGRRSAESQGPKAKCKLLVPYRVALALIDDGWSCRNDITWYKPNAMPSSAKDRLTCQTECVFHFVKSRKYYYDLDAIRVPHKTNECWGEAHRKGSSSPLAIDKRGFVGGGPSLHTKSHYPSGKNPGDVIKWGDVPGQTPQSIRKHSGYFGPNGECLVDFEKGKNPGDFWDITTKPSNDYWCPSCKDFAKQKEMRCVRCGVKVMAHFAVYPEELCVKPIKSSCPTQVCRKCGNPREQIIETHNPSKSYQDGKNLDWTNIVGQKTSNPQSSKSLHRNKGGVYYSGKTVGFTDCGCGAGFEPGIVLDPMCGRGTTLAVAKKLGLRFIGIDINSDYCEMTTKWLSQVERLRVERPLEAYSGSLEVKL